MTNEQINITIAQACGWERVSSEMVRQRDPMIRLFESGPWWRNASENTIANSSQLPDYCADLNAMHEAEETLDALHMQDFVFSLLRVVNAQLPGRIIAQLGCYAHVSATASQRAEAFLRTIGKWEEEK